MSIESPYKVLDQDKTNVCVCCLYVCVLAFTMKNMYVQRGFLPLFAQLINDLSLCIAEFHFSPHTLSCFAVCVHVCVRVGVSVSENVCRG